MTDNGPTIARRSGLVSAHLGLKRSRATPLRGGPKFSRIGRAIRYSKTDLDEFMALKQRLIHVGERAMSMKKSKTIKI